MPCVNDFEHCKRADMLGYQLNESQNLLIYKKRNFYLRKWLFYTCGHFYYLTILKSGIILLLNDGRVNFGIAVFLVEKYKSDIRWLTIRQCVKWMGEDFGWLFIAVHCGRDRVCHAGCHRYSPGFVIMHLRIPV